MNFDTTLGRRNLLLQSAQVSRGAGRAGGLSCTFGGPVLRKQRAISSSRWRPSNLAYTKKLQKHVHFLKAAVLEPPLPIKPHMEVPREVAAALRRRSQNKEQKWQRTHGGKDAAGTGRRTGSQPGHQTFLPSQEVTQESGFPLSKLPGVSQAARPPERSGTARQQNKKGDAE